jgi:hypothetical protein
MKRVNLGMPGAGFDDVVAVEDGHSTWTVPPVALESAIGMDQQRPGAGRLRRHLSHRGGNHLHGLKLGVGD